MRRVIVHYHLFKNAGETINAIFRRSFGPASVNEFDPAADGVLSNEALSSHILDKPGFAVVTSHQARLPPPDIPDVAVFPVLFLRHPIDRAGSVYSYCRRRRLDEDQEPDFADLTEFVRWHLDDDMRPQLIRNFQVAHLSGFRRSTRGYALVNDRDLALALRRLETLPFFGIVERFDQSIRLADRWLRPHFGPLNLDYSIENRSPDRAASLSERIEAIRAELGEELYAGLVAKNDLDFRLYRQACSLFNARA